MGKLAKNYIYNVAYQILIILTPIITAPYLTRVLGASNLGIYSYVNSVGSIVTTVSLLGIYAYGNRQTAYVRDNKEELTKTFWELELTRLVLGGIGTAVYLFYLSFEPEYRFYFLIYYPYILAQFLDCSWVYVGLEDMRPAVVKNFLTKLVNVVGIFLLVKKREDVWIYIFMLAATTLIANISVYSQLPKYIGKPAADRKQILPHIRGSIHLFLPQVASLFYLQVDKVMLEWLTGTTEQVSFYDQAEKIITIPLSLITVMSTVMMPRIANEFKKNNKERIQQLLIQGGRYALFLAFPMLFGLLCISRQFIPWYLGEEYMPTAYAMMILVPIVLFNSLSGISGSQYFTATNQTGMLMKAYLSAAIMNVIVNFVTIPKIGYAGAAAATVISSLTSVAIQFYNLSKQVRLGQLVPYGIRYGLYSGLMAWAVSLISYRMPAGAMTTMMQVITGGSVYLLCLWIFKDETLFDMIHLLKKRWKK